MDEPIKSFHFVLSFKVLSWGLMHWNNLYYTIWHVRALWTICSLCVCVFQPLSPVRLCGTPWTVTHQASLSMGFSRHAYWSGLPCPPPEDLPDPGIKLRSPTSQADSSPSEPQGKPERCLGRLKNKQLNNITSANISSRNCQYKCHYNILVLNVSHMSQFSTKYQFVGIVALYQKKQTGKQKSWKSSDCGNQLADF